MITGAPFRVPVRRFIVGGASIIFTPMARAYARRMDRESKPDALPADVSARLERMEQAIEAIAVEVERISEGQSFTTKMLSERATEPTGAIPAAERVS